MNKQKQAKLLAILNDPSPSVEALQALARADICLALTHPQATPELLVEWLTTGKAGPRAKAELDPAVRLSAFRQNPVLPLLMLEDPSGDNPVLVAYWKAEEEVAHRSLFAKVCDATPEEAWEAYVAAVRDRGVLEPAWSMPDVESAMMDIIVTEIAHRVLRVYPRELLLSETDFLPVAKLLFGRDPEPWYSWRMSFIAHLISAVRRTYPESAGESHFRRYHENKKAREFLQKAMAPRSEAPASEESDRP